MASMIRTRKIVDCSARQVAKGAAGICSSDQLLESLIQNSTDGIIVSDLKGNILLFNKAAERLFGYTAEEVIGKLNAAAFYPPGVAQDVLRKLRDDRFGGRGKLSPHRFSGISKSGGIVPLNLSGALLYENGLEIASIGIFSDLRPIVKAREEILASEVKFHSLFETVGHGLYFSTSGVQFLDCNQALLDMLGYETKEELRAAGTLQDFFVDASRRAEFWSVMERQGYVKDYEVKLRKRNVEEITVLINAHTQKDRSGTVLAGYQVIIVDVTESRRLAQQLYQSDKLAAMGRLTAQIAHELNNPIYGGRSRGRHTLRPYAPIDKPS